MAAKLGSPGETVHYAVAKAGLNSLTMGLAKEFGSKGILVNAIAPGVVLSPLHQKHSNPEWIEDRVKSTLLGRAGYPKEIAAMAVYLALNPVVSYTVFFIPDFITFSLGTRWFQRKPIT